MYETKRPGLPTWAKVLIGILAGVAVLVAIGAAIVALFLTRFVRVIQSESSGVGGATFASSLRWQHGILVADVTLDRTNKESGTIVRVTSVTLGGVSSDHFVASLQKPGTLSFPLDKYRGVGGDQEQIRINYETPNTGESGYETSSIDVPPKPIDSSKAK